MRGLLVFLALLELGHCSCPSGFELIRNGECRGKYATVSVKWMDAFATVVDKCKEIGGQPVIIHTEEQQSYWNGQQTAQIVLGLICNSKSKKWEWSDGSPLDYKPAKYSSALSSLCSSGITWAMMASSRDDWTAVSNDRRKIDLDVFCTTQLQNPVLKDDGCEGFEADTEDGVCYQIVKTTPQSFREAQMICSNFGSALASIHNLQENSFLRRLAVSKGAVNGILLGSLSSGNDFTWIDGSDWNYNNFYPGFPINGLGDCVAMQSQDTSGYWVNVDCSSQLPVACMRKQNETPNYPAAPWKEGQIIYSPGFPFDSSTPADFILTVDDGKKVELEIILLEANSCCDHLILYDNYIGRNVIADLTGEISNATFKTTSSNFMRVSWQPNGGVNVQGMMIKFRGV